VCKSVHITFKLFNQKNKWLKEVCLELYIHTTFFHSYNVNIDSHLYHEQFIVIQNRGHVNVCIFYRSTVYIVIREDVR